jgi:hypothetical protein
MNINAILKDKKVLYVMVFITLFTILGYLFNKDFNAIIFFLLVGFLTTYFSKNMIIILLIPLLSTNLLVAMNQTPQFIREGMKGKGKKEGVALLKPKKKTKKRNKVDEEDEEEETEVVEVQNSSPGLDKILAGKEKGSDVTLDVDIDNAKTLEQAYDNIDNILGEKGVKNMSQDTTKLIEKQKVLMNNIKQMGPMVNSAKAMLNEIKGMGIDVDDIIKKVSPQMVNSFAGVMK